MKINTILSIAIASVLAFASCNKSDVPSKPVVTFTEIGHENSKVAMRGDDMHLEAEIVADGLIKSIHVELHSGDYEIENEYTSGKYIGVKNTEFHEHIEIPSDAPLGEYHLHFTVTDGEGQQTMAEAHVEIIEFNPDLVDED